MPALFRRYRVSQLVFAALAALVAVIMVIGLYVRSDQRANSSAKVESVTAQLVETRALAVALQDERRAIVSDDGVSAATEFTDAAMVTFDDMEFIESLADARAEDDIEAKVEQYNDLILSLLDRSVASDPALIPESVARQYIVVGGSLTALREAIAVEAALARNGDNAEFADAQELTDGWVDAVQLGAPVSVFDQLQTLAGFDAMTELRQVEDDVRKPGGADANAAAEARRDLDEVVGHRLDAAAGVITTAHDSAMGALAEETAGHRRQRIVQPGLVLMGLMAAAAVWQFGFARSEWSERRVGSTMLDIAKNDFDHLLESVETGDVQEAMVYPVEAPEAMGAAAEAFVHLQETAMNQALERHAGEERTNETIAASAHRTRQLLSEQRELLAELKGSVEDDQGESAEKPVSAAALDRMAFLVERTAAANDRLLVLGRSTALPVRVVGVASIQDLASMAAASCQEPGRVDILSDELVSVPAALGQDLVIILRELLDNALAYSPPPTPVDLSGQSFDGSYVFWIRDRGMGLDEDHLDVLNNDLAQGRRLSSLGADGMGLAVVSELAARHGMRVSLVAGEQAGVQARVEVPAQLIVSTTEAPLLDDLSDLPPPSIETVLPAEVPVFSTEATVSSAEAEDAAGPFAFDHQEVVPPTIEPNRPRSLSERLAAAGFGSGD